MVSKVEAESRQLKVTNARFLYQRNRSTCEEEQVLTTLSTEHETNVEHVWEVSGLPVCHMFFLVVNLALLSRSILSHAP